MLFECEVLIIGGGPAGISTAVQLERLGINFLLVEKSETVGGLVKNANSIENFPGVPFGISGENLVALFERHLDILDISHVRDHIASIRKEKNGFKSVGKNTFFSKIIVFSGGTVPKKLPEYEKFLDLSIFYDVVSAKEFLLKVNKDQIKTLIIGGGEAALDYSLSMVKSGRVDVFVRSNKVKANESLKNQVFSNSEIKLMFDTHLKNIFKVNNQIKVAYETKDSVLKFDIYDILIFAIGRKSALGEINLDFDSKKAQNGFFIIGDALRSGLGQIGIAVGDGLKAATEIYDLLRG